MNSKSAYIHLSKGSLYILKSSMLLAKCNFFMFFFLSNLQIPFGNVTDSQEAIAGLREKFEKRQAKEERKRKAQEKKKNTEGKKEKKPAKRRRTVEEEEETDEEEEVQMQLDDSSEYSDELEDEDLTAAHYPFAEKAPEVRNFTFLLTQFFHTYL